MDINLSIFDIKYTKLVHLRILIKEFAQKAHKLVQECHQHKVTFEDASTQLGLFVDELLRDYAVETPDDVLEDVVRQYSALASEHYEDDENSTYASAVARIREFAEGIMPDPEKREQLIEELWGPEASKPDFGPGGLDEPN